MKTYIISMNVDEELAEDAALALNGQVFTLSNKWSNVLAQVSEFLSNKGFPLGIAVEFSEVSEYFAHNLLSENWPYRDGNVFAASVTVNEPEINKGCADLLHLLKEKVCVESNFGLYVDYLTGKDLQWLYSRNKDEINLWLAESRTDLFELLESDRNVADIVTVSWAKDELGKYFKQYGRNRKPDKPIVL